MNRKIKDNEEVALHLAAEAEGKTDMDTVRKLVLEEMDFRKDLKDEQVLDLIEHVLNTEGRRRFLPMEEKERLLRQTFNSIRRLDILQELIDDERITEIMVIGRTIFWEKGGRCYAGHLFRQEENETVLGSSAVFSSDCSHDCPLGGADGGGVEDRRGGDPHLLHSHRGKEDSHHL